MEKIMNRQGVWDFWAKYYDRLWLQRVFLQPTRALVCRKIKEVEQEAQEAARLNILDMSCGTGQLYGDLVHTLGTDRVQYLGVDSSGAMLEQASEKFPEAAFLQSDVMRVVLDQTPFDLIVCSHSFPYYPDGEGALRNMAGMLKPSGYLLLSLACTDSVYDAVIFKLTSLTTSRAEYRSSRRMREIGGPLFRDVKIFRISEKFFLPSLYLFQWLK